MCIVSLLEDISMTLHNCRHVPLAIEWLKLQAGCSICAEWSTCMSWKAFQKLAGDVHRCREDAQGLCCPWGSHAASWAGAGCWKGKAGTSGEEAAGLGISAAVILYRCLIVFFGFKSVLRFWAGICKAASVTKKSCSVVSCYFMSCCSLCMTNEGSILFKFPKRNFNPGKNSRPFQPMV